MSTQLDHLDGIAKEVAKGDESRLGPLSTGESLYVALASNRGDLLASRGYTIAEALSRLGEDWTASLIERWRYAGDPKAW